MNRWNIAIIGGTWSVPQAGIVKALDAVEHVGFCLDS
jgi:hypothetical protein